MNRSGRKHLDAPIIQDVIRLNNCLIEINSKAYKVISRTYIDPMLKQGALLFSYAMRQVRGMDYYKRATELTYELQFGIYLIVALGGCSKEKVSVIDVLCVNILSSLARIKNVRSEKS